MSEKIARPLCAWLTIAAVMVMSLILGYSDQSWVKLAVLVIFILLLASDLVMFYNLPRPPG